MTHPSLSRLAALLLVVLLGGCSEDVVVKRMKPAPAAMTDLKPVEDITAALEEFDPPFQEQIALFEPDKKKRPAAKNTTSRPTTDAPNNSSEPEVELVGFGAVDAAHALLLIDGRMEALRVGEQYRNVHVLKIAPPLVKLRVGGRAVEKTLVPK